LNEIKPYIEISKPKLRNNLKQLFAMKKIILILTIIPCLAAAQERDIFNPRGLTGTTVNICAYINGSLGSVYDDRVKWELWVEPTYSALNTEMEFEQRMEMKGIDDTYIQKSKAEWAGFVEHAQGTTFSDFVFEKPGYYHFTLLNKNNGNLLAYVLVVMPEFYLRAMKSGTINDHEINVCRRAPYQIDWGPSMRAKGMYDIGLAPSR